jgi:hypothetical protein
LGGRFELERIADLESLSSAERKKERETRDDCTRILHLNFPGGEVEKRAGIVPRFSHKRHKNQFVLFVPFVAGFS